MHSVEILAHQEQGLNLGRWLSLSPTSELLKKTNGSRNPAAWKDTTASCAMHLRVIDNVEY